MRTPINQDSFENAIARGRVNVPDFKNEGFFTFTNKKIDGSFKVIGIIRCHDAYKVKHVSDYGRESFFLFDFCFEDYLPLHLDSSTEVEEGDIINIRSMINLNFPPLLSNR